MTGFYDDMDTPKGWALTWSIIYLFNLPVALFYGWMETQQVGRIGMLMGILLAWMITGGLFGVHRLLRRVGWWGGVGTALSQVLMGFPQVIAGFIAMEFADSLGFDHPYPWGPRGQTIPGTGELWGLTATVGTAGLMCCVAVFLGLFCTAVIESWDRPTTRRTFAKPTGAGLGDFE